MFITSKDSKQQGHRCATGSLRRLAVTMLALLAISACNSASAPGAQARLAEGPIPDWPEAVRKAVAESPDLVIGEFGIDQVRALSAVGKRINALNTRADSATETGLGLVERGNGVIAGILPERRPVVPYQLDASNECKLGYALTQLANSLTKIGEAFAKDHAFSHGNEFSWPGFIQAVWADVSADRASRTVETGSVAADADTAIHELDSVIWHAVKSGDFELQSFAVTGDTTAENIASLMNSASQLAGGAQFWLGQCKEVL